MSSPQIRIIAISGRSGSGMTTLAQGVVSQLLARGVEAEYFSCMDSVYRMLGEAFGENAFELMTTKKKFDKYHGSDFAYHTAALDLLSAIRIGHSENFSTHALDRKLRAAEERGVKVAVVDDVRLMPDKKYLESQGAKFVRISTPGFAGDAELYDQVVEPHDMSDHELDQEKWVLSFAKLLDPKLMSSAVLQTYRKYLEL